MTKQEELQTPESCLNKAEEDEPLFVLRGKDPCAPDRIREWAIERILRNLNDADDPKIREALNIAVQMEKWREEYVKRS